MEKLKQIIKRSKIHVVSIKKTKIMVSGPITSCQIDGGKAMTNLGSVLKSRDITLQTKSVK